MSPYLQVFTSRRIGITLLLGFASGLPLALTGGTLQAWMAVAGVDLKTIGFFTLAGLPYTWKFLWAPLMDRFVPPFFGRRRGWMIVTQVALVAGIATMGGTDPTRAPWALAALAVMVAFSSASQDIVFDAYRTDMLRENERGVGAAVTVLGYRVAMLVSGAVALILSDRIGWQHTYWLMAGLMGLGVVATLFGPEPERAVAPPASLMSAAALPLKEFFSRRGAIAFLLLLVLYKLGDAFAGALTTAFLIKGMGFTATEVGTINKGMGMIATIIGVMFGGALMIRLGLTRALLLFGVLQAVSNLGFMWLAAAGKSYPIMVLAVAVENIAGGMGTAAFVALMMALCDARYSATQYALLSAVSAVGRVYVGPASGYVVEAVGWPTFFALTFCTAMPGLAMVWALRARLDALDRAKSAPEVAGPATAPAR